MPEIDESQLKKQIAAGELYRVYLIAGEEKYLVKRAAKRLIKKAGGDAFPEFNSQEFGSAAAVDSIADAAEALPFFAEHKCVSVADLPVEEKDAAETEKLLNLLENLPETTTLVFWYPTGDPGGAKWTKFVKAVQKEGGVLLCGRQSASDLQKMLMKRAEQSGCALSRGNAAKILDYAGQDVTQLLGEMEKLCSYTLGRNETEITAESIEELVPKSMETTVFLMANALVAGNYEKAYSLLDNLLYQKEKPVAILGALSSAYVDMARVQAALGSGKTAEDAAEYGDYKGKSFRLRNAGKNLRAFKPETLRKSLDLLLEADMALKGSRLDGRIVLEELIAKLLLAAKGERT